MRAVVVDASGTRLERRAPQPSPEPGEALLRPVCLGLARSDLEVHRRRVAFEGVLGHEFVAVVEGVEGAEASLVGARVVGSINVVCGACDLCRAGLSAHCRRRAVLGLSGRDGCFADRFVLPVRNLVRVPDGIDSESAVFAEPLAGAIHAAQLIRLEGRPYVTILGDGVMGLLCAQVMSRLNASVRLLGRHPEKFGLCEKWGVKHRHVDEAGRRHDQDVVVDCTGRPEGLAVAVELVRPRGTVIVKSAPAPVGAAGEGDGGKCAGPVAACEGVMRALVVNELELIGARCGQIADAIAMLARGQIDVASLISRRFGLDQALEALHLAEDPRTLKVLLEP